MRVGGPGLGCSDCLWSDRSTASVRAQFGCPSWTRACSGTLAKSLHLSGCLASCPEDTGLPGGPGLDPPPHRTRTRTGGHCPPHPRTRWDQTQRQASGRKGKAQSAGEGGVWLSPAAALGETGGDPGWRVHGTSAMEPGGGCPRTLPPRRRSLAAARRPPAHLLSAVLGEPGALPWSHRPPLVLDSETGSRAPTSLSLRARSQVCTSTPHFYS